MSRALKDYNSVDWSSLFIYDPTIPTGLRWKVDRYSGMHYHIHVSKRGSAAGNIQHDHNRDTHYAVVTSQNKSWFAHRVIWIMHNGSLDNELVIDHIDGNSLNNNINNLRAVMQEINTRNSRKKGNNSSGVTGVRFVGTSANLKDGKISVLYVQAEWVVEKGKRKTKRFNANKMGLLPAFAAACRCRENALKKMNDNELCYSETHGI